MGLYLDTNHRQAVESAESGRLKLQVLTLLAEAEYDQSLWMPEQLLEPRFNRPDSGLYALVTADNGERLWSSPSALTVDPGSQLASTPTLALGGEHFIRGPKLFQFSYQIVWETETGVEIPLMFTVLEDIGPADIQLGIYRRGLLLWLGGSALLLIACQAVILIWGLRPLHKLAARIVDIESGAAEELRGSYPHEIQRLTDGLNTLLQSEKSRRERVRNTLADLAHSLKTPLAVIRSADTSAEGYGALVDEQIQQMEQTVGYQLQRAAGGSHRLLGTVPVAAVAERIKSSLVKVYADREVSLELLVDSHCVFRGDERDLLELLGTLMDNACKYGHRSVVVSASGGGARPLSITVEDDGEGIPAKLREAILQRGTRADSQQGGHGIGLAVAADLVNSYLGTLTISESSLGGALIVVEIP
jgi:two-component system sensor histidine kinase PhoQ